MKNFVATLCLLLAFTCSKLHGQGYLNIIGDPAYSTNIPIENGFINVNNGEIHLEIPLAKHAQRGSLQLNERLIYDSRIWKIVQNGGYSWQPTNVANSMGGWRFQSGLGIGTAQSVVVGSPTTVNCNNQPLGATIQIQPYRFSWQDPSGGSHWFDAVWNYETTPFCPSQITGQQQVSGNAMDSSGYTISLNGTFNQSNPTVTIYEQTGNEVYPIQQDPNGNYLSSDSNGNLVDTLGRTPVLVSTNGNQIYYDVLSYNGARSRYTVTTQTVNVSTAFNEQSVTEYGGSFTAIQSIRLPDGTSYSFTYDSGTSPGNYGELQSVTLPTGGVIQYTYTNFLDSFNNQNRWIKTRVKDGGATTFTPQTISACSSNVGCQEKTIVTSPDNNDTVYIFTLDKGSYSNASSWVTEVDFYQGLSTSGGTELKAVKTNYTYNVVTFGGSSTYNIYYQTPSTITTTVSLLDVSLTAQTVTTMSYSGVYVQSVKLWDYYPSSQGPPSSPTETTSYSTYPIDKYIGSGPAIVVAGQLPCQTIVKDGSGNLISQTTCSYDQGTPTATAGLPHHNSTSLYRGNLTNVSRWIDSSGATLSTSATYDDAGTVLSRTDPNGTTSYGYDGTDTFATSTTLPTPSSGVGLTYGTTVDFSTGLSTGQTDPNNTQNVPQGYDAFGRPTGFVVSNGTTTYGKSSLYNTSTQSSDYEYENASVYADKETLYDGYGRLSRVANANGQASNPWYQVDTCYDSTGRANFQSYRYQANGFASPKICSGSGDTYVYDGLNRIKTITHSDGTTVQFSYTGRATKVTDENGVTRISQIDGLGRTTIVCEISSNSSMPGSGSPGTCGTDISGTGFTTTYSYAMASHTMTVAQGMQTRTFQTDWLGRSVSVLEPESSATTYSYAYNGTGLAVTRKRPKANQSNPSTLTTTTSQFDALGRLLSVTYDDGTPSKTFTYDVSAGWTDLTQTNLKGYMSLASVSGASTIFAYDPTGRITDQDECLPSGCGNVTYNKKLHYQYDWIGNVLSSTDAGSATSTYTVSPAGEILSLTSSLNNSSDPPNILSNAQYGPKGPTSYSLGNGLSGVLSYDGMGRVSGGWICSGSTAPYCSGGTQVYGFTSGWAGSRATQECDTVLNQCMNFAYDEFGRVSSRTVTSGTAQNFAYVYDRYGNRWYQNVTAGSGPAPQLNFNTATNQIVQGTCNPASKTQYCYDAAGNVTADGFHTYTYDAEGNVIQVDGGSTGQYMYNALNQRVRAQAFSTVREFVFDAAGQRVSMWNGSVPGQGVQGQYYWDGAPLAYYKPGGGAHFQHQDWLGTERMRTSYAGAVEDTYTSLPFGDAQTTGTDNDPYHFAALDFDSESNLDHAGFREYSSTQGRWMEADPYGGSYDLRNPQSLNRYSYVMNGPLSVTDPSGQIAEGPALYLGTAACGPACGVIAAIGVGIADLFGLEGLFGGPSFHGSLHPRPNATGDPNWDGNFGERLGISTKVPRVNLGVAAALGLPDAGCEFGACGAGGMNLTQGQQTSIANAAKSWFGTPYAYGECLRTGADCSGSVYAIYLMAGIKLPHKFSSGEYPKSPLFQRVTGAPQVGDVGWYPGHVVIYGGVTGPNGDDVWSATHTGGAPFGPANSKWFGNPSWYRYVGP